MLQLHDLLSSSEKIKYNLLIQPESKDSSLQAIQFNNISQAPVAAHGLLIAAYNGDGAD